LKNSSRHTPCAVNRSPGERSASTAHGVCLLLLGLSRGDDASPVVEGAPDPVTGMWGIDSSREVQAGSILGTGKPVVHRIELGFSSILPFRLFCMCRFYDAKGSSDRVFSCGIRASPPTRAARQLGTSYGFRAGKI
jgi:hypothetical protein